MSIPAVVLKSIEVNFGQNETKIPEKLKKYLFFDFKRLSDTEVAIDMQMFSLYKKQCVWLFTDNPLGITIKSQNGETTKLAKIIVVAGLISIIFAPFCIGAVFFAKYLTDHCFQMINDDMEGIIKHHVLIPEQSTLPSCKELPSAEIAEKLLQELPALATQFGEGSSCMLAPNISPEVLGAPLARIAPGTRSEDVIAVIDTTMSLQMTSVMKSRNTQTQSSQVPPVAPFTEALFITRKGLYRQIRSDNKTTLLCAEYDKIGFFAPIKNKHFQKLTAYVDGMNKYFIAFAYRNEKGFYDTDSDSAPIYAAARILADFVSAMRQ